MDLNFSQVFYNRAKQRVYQQAYKSVEKDPQTLKQVLKSPNHIEWLKAIYQEFDQLVRLYVFSFIARKDIPKNKKPITSRLVLRTKRDQNHEIIKFKARLVARGFQQVEGIDFDQTFASTAIPSTWRLLLALATIYDWVVDQIDFIGAFLNGILKEEILLNLPEGFKDYASQATKVSKAALKKLGYNPDVDQVIQLNRALYGLKKASREWQQALTALCKKLGYKPSVSDSAIYYSPKSGIFVATHVDDCLIGPNKSAIAA